MGIMAITVEEFVAKKEKEFKKDRRLEKRIMIKDIGGGKQYFVREEWIFLIQSDDPNKVLVLERLRRKTGKGKKCEDTEEGCLRYRIGYYIVGKIKDFPIKITHAGGKFIWEGYTKILFKKDTLTWEGYCPIIPKKDLKDLLRKAAKKGVISKDVLLPGVF